MGAVSTNPYSSQSIVNYNASPPPDDGSTGNDNKLEWAKHKTKLADPIKTLTEAVDSAVSSAFAKSINTDSGVRNQVSGSLAFEWATATIGTDVLDITLPSHLMVGAESGATQDTLQRLSATGVYDGAMLTLKPRHATEEILVIHATSTAATATGPNIFLANRTNYLMDSLGDTLTLVYESAVASGWVEKARAPGTGTIVQYTATEDTTVTACGTAIPADGSTPLSSEGDEVFSLAVTPTAVGNHLIVEFNGSGASTTDPAGAIAALFATATTAVAAQGFVGGGSGSGEKASVHFRYATTATGTAAKTFSVRCGPTAGTFHLNAMTNTATANLGGVAYSSLTIWEVAA